jgi:UDP-N-acetylmuramoyl-tripeptide--D-alanyl-D-alanine ligase
MTSFIKNQLTQIFCRQMQKIIKKHKPIIVAVAGSVGKTTTKLAIATVLSETLRVQYQKGNYNTPISIPLIFTGREMPSLYNPFSWIFAWLHGQRVLHSKYPYDVVVVELGTDAPGDIPHFESLIHPKISVITAVAEEHMEFFKTLDAIAAEELSVANFSDIVVINSDDIAERYLEAYIPKTKEVHSYGFGHAEYKISVTKNDKPEVSIDMGGGHNVTSKVDFAAKHSLKSIAAAVAVADLLEQKPEDIQKAILKITSPAGRMQLLDGIKDSKIIDDTYNSSPLAAKAALDSLYDYDAPQRIAILGMMNELGETSKSAHTAIGNYCDPSKLDLVVTIGQDANEFLAPAAENKGCKVIKCNGPTQAGKAVAENLKSGAVILAKGSQNGVFAEEAIKQLLADPEDAGKLVRQNAFWLKKKQSILEVGKR